MPHILKLKPHDSVEILRQAIKDSDDESHKTRLRAIVCIKEGMSHTATANRFVVCRTSIVSWMNRYNEGGIAALKMSKGGRPEGRTKWEGSIFDALVKEIDARRTYWSVPLMRTWIKETYKQDIPEQTIWYRIHRLKYSYKSARPHPYQGNAEKQEAFKKGGSSP